MTSPINIYTLSRIQEEDEFNIIKRHSSCCKTISQTQYHEIESLRMLSDAFVKKEVAISELDGFFYAFHIPHIGKEFDLLRFTDDSCLNIELKSSSVPEEQIKSQLIKNRHYLGHIGRRMLLYSVITDKMTCYKLALNNELHPVRFDEIVNKVQETAETYVEDIDSLFRASDYLISPLNHPNRFVQGEYFLTQAQEQIKKNILTHAYDSSASIFFHLTGKPGTGKSLLLYDLAKTLSKEKKTLIIHCGKLTEGQKTIQKAVSQLNIIPAALLRSDEFSIEEYRYILIDESHRIYPSQFESICNSVKNNHQICVFSSDPEQILSSSEKRHEIVKKIKELPLDGEYILSEKIRTNEELYSFITCVKNLNHRPRVFFNYSNVDINYANTTKEAQYMLEYYRNKGFTFINYSKSNYGASPYSIYEEDFDTHHVIGQEFDKVVMLLDSSFFYDDNGILRGIPHPTPDYLYPNLFYQGITRVREKLALIIVNAPQLFEQIVSIVQPSE